MRPTILARAPSLRRWPLLGLAALIALTALLAGPPPAEAQTSPTLSSAAVDGTTLALVFSESLDDNSTPANSDFEVRKTEPGDPFSTAVSLAGTPSISGSTVTLTLESAVKLGDTVTVSYTKPTTNPLRASASGNAQVESFSDQSVTNNTLPTISSAWVSESSLTIAFDVSLAAADNLANTAFTVKVDGSAVSLSATEGPSISSSMVTLTLASAIASTTTATVTVSYSQPTTGTDNLLRGEGTSGTAGRVASFTDQAASTPPNFVSATVNGTTLTVTFDENLDTASAPTGSAFSLQGSGSLGFVFYFGSGATTISGMTATVTLSLPVAHGDSVFLNYVKAGEDPLQDAASNEVPSLSFRPVTNNTPVPDTTVPTLVGGTIRESTVRLYFNEPMDTAATLTAAGITLTSSSSLGAVSNPTWVASEPNILTLTTATAADTTQAVQVSIAASAGVQDAAGNALATVTNFELTNIGGSAPGAPALSTVEVEGDTLTLTYNQTLLPRYPPPGDFTVSATGTTTTVNSLAINPGASTSTVVLMLSTPVKSTDTVTLSYSKASAPRLQNPWGIQVAVLTSEAVTNNTAAPVSTTPPARIWSSWLTVYVLHGAGCETPSPNADPLGLPPLESEYVAACIRRLTDYSFMHEEVRYEFNWVGRQGTSSDEHLVVGFASIDDGSVPVLSQQWTLHVDNSQFPVADSSLEVEDLEGVNVWTNPGFDWTAGQQVWLCLTTGGASCAKPATPVIPAPDNTAPAFSSAVVDRATLTVTFNEALDENSGSPDKSAFDVTVAGSRRNVASDGVAIAGRTVTLTLESAVAPGQIVTLAYIKPTTQGGSPLRDRFINNVQSFSGKSVTHGRPPSGGGFVVGGFVGGGGPSGPSPSAVDFEWNVKRDIEALDSSHGNPTGLWGDGETLLLLENGSGAADAVYAYDLESGERVEEREFALDERNRAPRGIWADAQGVAWVSDSGRNKLFAYDLASGERLEDRDIDLHERNAAARGIWADGETMWVLDGRRDALFAYDLETGEALAEYRLHTTNDDPHDLWSDGVTIWVSNHDPKRLFAYRLPALPSEGEAPPEEPEELERVRDEVFDKLSRASNNSPRGIWSDGDVMYVVDALDGKVYTYNMPDAIDARLASLTLAGVDFGEFSPARTEYEGGAETGAEEATVEAVAAQAGASVVIEPADADPGVAGHQVALEGLAEITVTVTSQDGSRTRVYRVALAAPEEEPWAHSLKGAVAEGFSLLVYEGGSVEELAAAAESRGIAALYVLHEGRYVAYFPEAPDFVNEAFAALYADGVPALTPLVAASEGPPSADPVGELAAPGGWPACLHGEVGAGWSLVLHEGGSVEELAACAENRGVTALYVLHEGEWVSFVPAAPDFVNRAFAELYADGVPSLTPLVVRSDGAQADGADDGASN